MANAYRACPMSGGQAGAPEGQALPDRVLSYRYRRGADSPGMRRVRKQSGGTVFPTIGSIPSRAQTGQPSSPSPDSLKLLTGAPPGSFCSACPRPCPARSTPFSRIEQWWPLVRETIARGIRFAGQPRNRNTIHSRPMRFDMICEVETWFRRWFWNRGWRDRAPADQAQPPLEP